MAATDEQVLSVIEAHGFSGSPDWALPQCVARSNAANRADQKNFTKANEYLDSPQVLEHKMQIVADLIRKSKLTVAYTGAGLSRAAGIPDYGTKAKDSVMNSVAKLPHPFRAQPTYSHYVLAALEKHNLLHHILQQNHDGLPQKAGFPQEKINEIHGAWYDPSYPVVQFSESLRTDFFEWMLQMEQQADLTLCLGTSLSGMNADRIVETPAKKARKHKALGAVIINLQRTRLDASATVRIWAKLDDAFAVLATKLGLTTSIPKSPFVLPHKGETFTLPYNENGLKDPSCRIMLDLRTGQKVKIAIEHAPNSGSVGKVIGKDEEGNWRILFTPGGTRILGRWWVDAAIRGAVDRLPIVNEPSHRIAATTPKQVHVVQGHQVLQSSQNQHEWTLSLDPTAAEAVSQVRWILHPTFSPSSVVVDQAPFAITRHGWGVFKVGYEITMKFGEVIRGEHMLSFDDIGDSVAVTTAAA